jgi:hypothetical protein
MVLSHEFIRSKSLLKTIDITFKPSDLFRNQCYETTSNKTPYRFYRVQR